jgi:hypothetical protein
MWKSTIMPLNQPPISWRPVAPALCLALVQAGRSIQISQAPPGSPGATVREIMRKFQPFQN